MRTIALAALIILGGCSQPAAPAGDGGADQGKFAGLESELLNWRKSIVAESPLCRSQAEGEKCEGFDVACKAERTVTAADQAKGITARVVATMTWTGFDPKFRHAQNGIGAAEFVKGRPGWTRAPHGPVNMSTCADM